MQSVIFVIDIDGTVCDSIPRVREICKRFGVDENDNLDAIWTDETMEDFLKEENIMKDGVVPGAEKVLEIVARCRAYPFFLTGRNEYARLATRRWLSIKLGVTDDIPLLMRPYNMKNGYAADCKEQIFKENLYALGGPHATYIFFEDHEETAKRYSKYGLVLKAPECWGVIGDNL
jgi:hypothetical protein